MKPTLADIASNAGVSVSTVSQVLNGRGRIAEETRRRVLKAAEKSGYRKNVSKVTTRTSNAIPLAALVNTGGEWNFLWNFERELFNTIEDSLREQGFTLILIPIRPGERALDVLEKISVSGASAVFPMHYGNEELFDHLERMGIPLVVIFNSRFGGRFPSISVDDYGAAFTGAEHLISFGHRRLAYFDCKMDKLETTNRDRTYGFFNAAEESGSGGVKGMRVDFKREDSGDLTTKLEKLFGKPEAPTAAFAVDDDAAARIKSVCTEIGLRIPDDLSLLAIGDVLDYSRPHTPRISTLRIDTGQAGRRAAELMNRLIRQPGPGPGEVYGIDVPFTLVDRGSCGPPVSDAPPAGAVLKGHTEESPPGRKTENTEDQAPARRPGGRGTAVRSRRRRT